MKWHLKVGKISLQCHEYKADIVNKYKQKNSKYDICSVSEISKDAEQSGSHLQRINSHHHHHMQTCLSALILSSC